MFNLIRFQDALIARLKKSFAARGLYSKNSFPQLACGKAKKELVGLGYTWREAERIVEDANEVAWTEAQIEAEQGRKVAA